MSLNSIKPVAFAVSFTGLLGLLWVNIALLLGKPAPFELSFTSISFVLFPLWAFTIYYLKQARPPLGEEDMARMTVTRKIRYWLGDPPGWALVLLAGFYGYGLYSLFLFVNGGIADPQYVDGQYRIYDHGKVTVFTEAEYQIRHRMHLLSVSGFFMAFFAVSTVVLAPWRK